MSSRNPIDIRRNRILFLSQTTLPIGCRIPVDGVFKEGHRHYPKRWNHTLCKGFGHTVDKLIGILDLSFVPSFGTTRANCTLPKVSRRGHRFLFLRKSSRWFYGTSPVYDEQKTDVTSSYNWVLSLDMGRICKMGSRIDASVLWRRKTAKSKSDNYSSKPP